MFNLDTLATKDTFELHLKHPVTEELLYADTAQKEPVSIIIHGPSSPQYQNAVTAMQNRALKRQREKKVMSAEQVKAEGIDLLVACSESSTNLMYKQAPLDNPDAFKALYSDPQFSWIKDAVDTAVGEIANFLA